MTVSELIEKLQELEPCAPVYINGYALNDADFSGHGNVGRAEINCEQDADKVEQLEKEVEGLEDDLSKHDKAFESIGALLDRLEIEFRQEGSEAECAKILEEANEILKEVA